MKIPCYHYTVFFFKSAAYISFNLHAAAFLFIKRFLVHIWCVLAQPVVLRWCLRHLWQPQMILHNNGTKAATRIQHTQGALHETFWPNIFHYCNIARIISRAIFIHVLLLNFYEWIKWTSLLLTIFSDEHFICVFLITKSTSWQDKKERWFFLFYSIKGSVIQQTLTFLKLP